MTVNKVAHTNFRANLIFFVLVQVTTHDNIYIQNHAFRNNIISL